MARKEGLDDIIKGAAKLVGKVTKKGAKKAIAKKQLSDLNKSGLRGSMVDAKKVALQKQISGSKKAKYPPSPPKRTTSGKPPAVGSKSTSTRGGMNSKELDAYRKKTYSDSRNYFENSAKYQKDVKAAAKKNQLKKRGDYK